MQEKIDWIDLAEKALVKIGKKEAHVDDLIQEISSLIAISDVDGQVAKNRLSTALSRNTKSKKDSKFRRVKNKKGAYKKGVYCLKKEADSTLRREELPSVSSGYTGKAGEHSVLSELLFRGYNASIMSVDEGIDIVASKLNKYFHIQVKTANGSDEKPYSASIRREAFQHSTETFYIIVLRRPQKRRFINDYVVFSSSEIRRFIAQNVIKDTQNISLRIAVKKEKFILNDKHDVTHCVNDFQSLV